MEFFALEPRRVDGSVSSMMAAAGSQVGQFMERHRAQERVVESEALNSAIIAAALDCVISIDGSGRIIEFNPAATRTFGYTREQALGRELAEILVPERLRARHRDALRRSVQTGEARILGTRIEMPAKRADGTELTVELAITRVGDSDRPVFTAHLRDVTDRRRVEEERTELLAREQRARADAEDANRAKDQFLATISHELRTPLTAILGWTSMLRTRQFDPDRLQQIYESVYRNAEMQAQIVNDLLDVSRIVMGQLRLDLQAVDACEVARLSLETIRPTAIVKGVRLESDIPSSECFVSGDAARLQQVIWNLLSNAVKFTPAGGAVSLTVREAVTLVAIEVADTGVGLPADSLPRVFERFWQADSTFTRAHGGLGLGLALVRHLVELHGGEVEAASPGEQRGSTFTVTLPARHHESRDFSRSETQDAQPSQALHLWRALVVDDDASTRELFAAILEGHGAAVMTAGSAAEAVGLIQHEQPHFLIIDIGMPDEDGLMLLRRIRADETRRGRPPAPAIAVTAFAGSAHRDAALRAGFAAHLPKPVLPSDMIAAIVAAVRAAG